MTAVQSSLLPEILPTLPGCVAGIVGQDPWQVQCQECGHISEHKHLILAIRARELVFHPWADGTNPRLCTDCRLARDCDCERCRGERAEAKRQTRGGVR